MAFPWQRREDPLENLPVRRRRNRRRDRSSEVEETRQQSARLHEERRRQRLAITIGAMLILMIVGIVAVGYYREFYEPPRVTATMPTIKIWIVSVVSSLIGPRLNLPARPEYVPSIRGC